MTPSLTQAQIDTYLRAFLLQILPAGVEVIIGQQNRIPQPSPDNFVITWPVLRKRLATTVVDWDTDPLNEPSASTNTESVRIDIQLDFHGADSTDNAQVFATNFRSAYACQYFAGTGIQPDYCSDGAQMPFINGENQYEDRWTLTATLDANIAVTINQQFADIVTPEAINVDAAFEA